MRSEKKLIEMAFIIVDCRPCRVGELRKNNCFFIYKLVLNAPREINILF